jgi:hypothetical protein
MLSMTAAAGLDNLPFGGWHMVSLVPGGGAGASGVELSTPLSIMTTATDAKNLVASAVNTSPGCTV